MAMESLGGDMPAGQPVAVSSGSRTHVFAIAKGGPMNHWTSTNGGPWSVGPSPLPGGNLAASFPCALALSDGSVHVFAIGNGGPFGGGPLTRWSSADGVAWTMQLDPRVPIGANGNGLAAASPDGKRIDVFAVTGGGITQYTFAAGQLSATIAMLPNPASLNLRACVLAAVSSAPGTLDVFAVDPNVGVPLQWHFNGAWASPRMLAGPALHANQNNGFAAVSPAPGRVELFAVTADGRMTNWSINGAVVLFAQLAPGSWGLPDGVPGVVASAGKIDVFAIGQGDVLKGGPLVHWRFAGGAWDEPEAYDAGLAAGGVGVVHGASGLEAFAFQSGINNSLLHWPAGIHAVPGEWWQNWAANQRTNPITGYCYPTCLEELVAIVRTASQQGKPARAVGSSWSFSDIAMTPGFVVQTNALNKILGTETAEINRLNKLPGTVLPMALPPNPLSRIADSLVPPPHHFVHVEAGIQLETLMEFLDTNHMAPVTMGGASGQTLGGVISTSVHGSHFRLPPFPDWVRAIHLVGPDGKQYWIEPENQPITDRTKLAQLQEALGPEVTIAYDNDWFDAALVTVGSLGIVYSVVLEVRGEYKLRETRTAHSWSEFKTMPASSVFAKGVACVAVAIDPGSMGNADPACILATRAEVPFSTASTGKSFDALGAYCEGDLLLELLFEAAKASAKDPQAVILALLVALPAVPAVLALAVLFPPAVAALTVLSTAVAAAATVGAATSILYPLLLAAGPGALGDLVGVVLEQHPDWVGALSSLVTMQFQGPTPAGGVVDIAHNIMGPKNKGECATRGLGLEIAFDADGSHITFIDAALALLKDEAAMGHMLGGWFSIRFVGQSWAILSPQRTTMTCMIEIVGLRTLSSTKLLFDKLEALGRKLGGIQHWGMFNDLRLGDVAGGYPRLNTWRQVRWELTNNGTVHTFDNDFTRRCGLSDPPQARHAVGPAVRSADKLDVFVTDVAGVVKTAAWDQARAGGWNGWSPIGKIRVPPGAPVHAVSRSADKLDIFVTDVDGVIQTAAWTPAFADGWHGWWEVAKGRAAPGAPVTVVSRSNDKLDVFVVGTDGRVYTAAWEPAFADWQGWWPIGSVRAPAGAPVHAVSRSADKLDIFVTDVAGVIQTAAWAPAVAGGWQGWWSIGAVRAPSGAPVHAVSRSADTLDIFVTDVAGVIQTAAWRPAFADGWHGWWPIGAVRAPAGAPVHAVSRSADTLDIFVTDVAGVIQTAAWMPAFADGWHGWWPITNGRAAPGAAVTAVSRSADKLDVFVTGTDGRVRTAAWEPAFADGWHGWFEID